MKRFCHLLRWMSVVFVGSSLLAPALNSARGETSGPLNEIVIVSTTDLHSALDHAEGVANVIQELRQIYGEKMIYVDAGDEFQGSLEGDLQKGYADVQFFNALQLDVAAIGNHEPDFGPKNGLQIVPTHHDDPVGNLRARMAEAHYPWLSANWIRDSGRSKYKNARGEATMFQPHAVIERGRKRICFTGATTIDAQVKSLPAHLKGSHFEPLLPVVRAEALQLRQEKCDLVILVAHAGLVCKSDLDPADCLKDEPTAEVLHLLGELPKGTLDAVVAGHTHRRAQVIVNSTPVLEAGAYGQVVGILHISLPPTQSFHFDPFKIVSVSAENAEISKLLKPARDQAKVLKDEVVGELDGDLTRVTPHDYQNENAFANFMADSYLDEAHLQKRFVASISIVPAGQLRASLNHGRITYGNLAAAIPFTNSLVTVSLRGSQIRQLLQTALGGRFGLAATAGLKIHVKKKSEGERDLLSVQDLKGHALLDQKTYEVVTTEYIAGGGDNQKELFDHVPKRNLHVFGGRFGRDILADEFRHQHVIHAARYFDAQNPRVIIEPN